MEQTNRFKEIENKWQKWWGEHPELYRAENDNDKPKKYILNEFPYPSGSGLHVGHAFSFTGGDVFARFKRMQGYNVLFPMGWDAFGLPTENFAIKMKKKPQQVTLENTNTFRSQMDKLAFSFDWSREVNTTDPNYYKWTQWIFVKLFEAGLAYKKEMPINWCPSCKIGLANEEVVDNKCERCGASVSRRNISQWVVKITDYADRLIDGLKDTRFIDKVKMAQINWIGRKEGINIDFEVKNTDQKLTVFTTTPVNFGATFLVVAPEHQFVTDIINGKFGIESQQIELINKYIAISRKKSEIERTELGKDKTGVFSGMYAINHVNGKEIPIWITDFVLANYGTGAVQGCPAHDERDFAFAKKFGLPIVKVVDFDQEMHVIVKKQFVNDKFETRIKAVNVYFESRDNEYWMVVKKEKVGEVKEVLMECISEDGFADVDGIYKGRITSKGLTEGWSFDNDHHGFCYQVHSGDKGTMVNSDFLNGIDFTEAMKKTMDYFEEKGWGKRVVSYHLRDWIFSRQHYWGEPIPMVDCPKCGWVTEKEVNLPIVLPEVEAYEPTDDGLSPLSRIPEFVNCKCPKCGDDAKRETDTMPNWAGSDWYFLRYIDPFNSDKLVDFDLLKKWGPVDIYIGGDEHNTLHLLYSRFIYQFLYDLGVFPKELTEPYNVRMSHGVILGPDNARMSKSKGNVIVPESVADKFGVDVIRMYLMFMGPFDGTMAWNESTLMGVKRFLDRFEKYVDGQNINGVASSHEIKVIVGKLVDSVTSDLEVFGYNTVVAKLMKGLNDLEKLSISKEDVEIFIKLIAPMAPYMAQELWSRLGHNDSVHVQSWPVVSEDIVDKTIELPVAINGKVRDQLIVETSNAKNQKEIVQKAKELINISKWLVGKTVVKEIYVEGKMINLVVRD